MSRSTNIFIVCSPRARVGKTMVARLCAEFYRADARTVSVFDLDSYENALSQFLPELAAGASLDDIRGQMDLFDRLVLDDERPKVIDVGHLAFRAFFETIYKLDFAAEARRRAINAIVLFVADPDPVSAETYALLQRTLPDFAYLPVFNDAMARGPEFHARFPSRSGHSPLHIAQLSSTLRWIVERRPFSFADHLRDPPADLPESLRLEMEAWLKRTFRQLREIELQLLMDSLKFSLSEPAASAQ